MWVTILKEDVAPKWSIEEWNSFVNDVWPTWSNRAVDDAYTQVENRMQVMGIEAKRKEEN
jgi:23S rRNA G2445 N2-methylase RlmL